MDKKSLGWIAKMAKEYGAVAQANRTKFLEKLRANGLDRGYVYLQGGVTMNAKWSDFQYPFRQEKNFYYLTGVSSPGYHVLLDVDKELFKLIMPKYDEHYAVWVGKVPNKEDLKMEFDIDVVTVEEAKEMLKNDNKTVYVFDGESKVVLGMEEMKNVEINRLLLWAVQKCRLIKNEVELQYMRKAGIISGNAHVDLMLSLKKEPITTEKKLQALFEYSCTKSGAHSQAYNPIVALGNNAAHLHYNENNSDVGSNPYEVLLVDAGGEFEGYAADITRSYPVGGVFSQEAKTLYNIVLDMQLTVLNALKPGVTWKELQSIATTVASRGLIEIGLIKGSHEDENVTKLTNYFFCHGIGHYIGLDVHDVGGNNPEPPSEDSNSADKSKSITSIPIPANSVLTVEPGLYFSEYAMKKISDDEVLSKYVDIPVMRKYASLAPGIRIEDLVIIHENHVENLSDFVPKTIEAIEGIFS